MLEGKKTSECAWAMTECPLNVTGHHGRVLHGDEVIVLGQEYILAIGQGIGQRWPGG